MRTGGMLAWRWSVSRGGGKQEFGFGIILSFPGAGLYWIHL